MNHVPTIEVDNPGYEPGHPGSIKRVVVERALRDDPLGQMHDRRQIGEYQYRAGRKYQEAYEAAGIGHIKAMDSTQEPVDGSRRPSMGMTDRRLAAGRQRASWRLMLGGQGFILTELILIDKLSVREAAARLYDGTGKSTLIYTGRRFRECLDVVAKDLGLVSRA